MLDGYKSGVFTEKRLHDALKRLLGLKASLGLHRAPRDELVAQAEALALVGSTAHRTVAAAIADKTVTLIKDTSGNLPITPATHKRIRLYGISGERTSPAAIRWPIWIWSRRSWRVRASRCMCSRRRRSGRPTARRV
ncbi:hypothetical protein [Arthrobacter sp. A5]|uniref:hypothetical protein n=1 Tax=Arthrobacter sp. A5 TaxID=576926 RepID=UPI003DA9EAD3